MICTNKAKPEMTRFGIGTIALLVALAMFALTSLSVSAQKKLTIAGDYAGTLGPLHVKLHLKAGAAGKLTGTLDSLERGAIGIDCSDFHVDGQSVAFTVPAVRGKWKGIIAADGTLAGTWDQGDSLPLNFARDATALAENAPKTGEILLSRAK